MVGWGGGEDAPVWADGAEVTHVGGRGLSREVLPNQ